MQKRHFYQHALVYYILSAVKPFTNTIFMILILFMLILIHADGFAYPVNSDKAYTPYMQTAPDRIIRSGTDYETREPSFFYISQDVSFAQKEPEQILPDEYQDILDTTSQLLDELYRERKMLPSEIEIYPKEDIWNQWVEFSSLPKILFTDKITVHVNNETFILPWPNKAVVEEYRIFSITNALVTSPQEGYLAQLIQGFERLRPSKDGLRDYIFFISYLAYGDLKKATMHLSRFTDTKEQTHTASWWNYFYLGRLYLMQANTTLALQLFDKAIEADPNRIVPLIYKARAYEFTSDFDTATSIYLEVLKKTEKKKFKNRIMLHICKIYAESKQWAKITALIEPLLDNKQVNPLLIRYYCNALVHSGHKDQVESVLTHRLEYEPQRDALVQYLAQFYFSNNKKDEAIALLEQQYRKNDKKLELAITLVRYYNLAGNMDSAMDVLESVLDKFPNYIPALLRIGILYFRQEKYDMAIEYLEKIMDKNIPLVYFLMGKSYYEMGDHDKAYELLDSYVTKFPNAKKVDEAYDILNRLNMNIQER